MCHNTNRRGRLQNQHFSPGKVHRSLNPAITFPSDPKHANKRSGGNYYLEINKCKCSGGRN